MKRSIASLLLFACSGLLVAGLIGCSSSEEKAQVKYSEASRVAQAGGEAEPLYQQLIGEFPETDAARQAQAQLELLQEKRQLAAKRQTQEVLESLQLVVEGYHSVFRQWPQSARDFDKADFIFDSDYMAETVSDRLTVYLALAGAERSSLWSFPAKGNLGYRLGATERSIVEVDRAAALAEIETSYRVELQKGGLVFLLPRG